VIFNYLPSATSVKLRLPGAGMVVAAGIRKIKARAARKMRVGLGSIIDPKEVGSAFPCKLYVPAPSIQVLTRGVLYNVPVMCHFNFKAAVLCYVMLKI
jgi:hypothetical protein